MQRNNDIEKLLDELLTKRVSPIELLPHEDLREKLIDLVLNGEPASNSRSIVRGFTNLTSAIRSKDVDGVKVVVFGGGTGLSNIIGGDSRSEGWAANPFSGLKEVFPMTRSVVCVTDDGGSTGELLKDLPLIAIGDIRHVLLSSVKLVNIQRAYQITPKQASDVTSLLAQIFNYRFNSRPDNAAVLFHDCCKEPESLPRGVREVVLSLIEQLFTDGRLTAVLSRPQCLGNLLIISAVYRFLDRGLSNEALATNNALLHNAIYDGLQFLSFIIGVDSNAVLPCTTTPSQLRIVYANGVQTKGESKSSVSRRGYPVDSVHVDYSSEPQPYSRVIKEISEADILIMAPGSLYSSIIPVFKVPGIAQAVRDNTRALKLLIANLWVQAGETDLSLLDPDRKFRVSDMIRAYEKNIPGGTRGLFEQVLCISLKDVPASVIQRYAVEGKIPIYLDRSIVRKQGYIPIECGIYSSAAMAERGVIQHDPESLAQVVKVLYATRDCLENEQIGGKPAGGKHGLGTDEKQRVYTILPSTRYGQVRTRLSEIEFIYPENDNLPVAAEKLIDIFTEIVWQHHDIPLTHLGYMRGIRFMDVDGWPRNQRWDNVYSFFDPEDMMIKIRVDQFEDSKKLETAFLIALGQSLLGNYAHAKMVKEISSDNLFLGKVYHLYLRDESERVTHFSSVELDDYLRFSRMFPGPDLDHYTRLINGDEGFTPPGLLMGLMYAWYLENMLATHIEYKMAVMKIPQTNLIPDQKKMVVRRKKMISFFRDVVFS
ncbi:2-phospho-L-lactate transferase CofD family protein [Desulfopila sp. IMCC35008]|uniref:gluconeogenesis factor YvcK family protein n=1 Tax=Desulfopila sp. IMCC35008 TaxID=2653858 RepID=UPI0013D45F6D|nr:2-phospho-L-lactate transferase CofD family protein [Desulfopila sp. IMCC35008]